MYLSFLSLERGKEKEKKRRETHSLSRDQRERGRRREDVCDFFFNLNNSRGYKRERKEEKKERDVLLPFEDPEGDRAYLVPYSSSLFITRKGEKGGRFG